MIVYAQVYRFRDFVAVYIGKGDTVYLSSKDARRLARALNRTAKSCDRESFTESTAKTEGFHFAADRNR